MDGFTHPTKPRPFAATAFDGSPSPLASRLIRDGLSPRPGRDQHGPIRFMAAADGYVMVRRPGCVPFVLTAAAWAALNPAREAAE